MKRSAVTNQTNAVAKKVKHVNPQNDGAKEQTSTTAKMQVNNNALQDKSLHPLKSMPNPSWQQTMLRVKDPEKSLTFYIDVMGMTLIDKLDFPSMEFSLYFLTTLPIGEKYPYTPGTLEANAYLWSMKGVTLELTHNYGTEKDNSKYHIGNKERDGFGHIAFACDDVYESCEMLEKKKIPFQKKPDEGRMKGLAFALDPDGYWVEIVSRSKEDCSHLPEFSLAQTMIRVKDPVKSLAFYTQVCGMTLISERHFKTFSLYFLGTVIDRNAPDMSNTRKFYSKGPVLELTHNHGTEDKEDFVHFNGNEKGRQGFGHIGFLVDDVYKACVALETNGVKFKKKPDEGKIKGLAFALDPDGYWIEIIPRGMVLKKEEDGTFQFAPKTTTTTTKPSTERALSNPTFLKDIMDNAAFDANDADDVLHKVKKQKDLGVEELYSVPRGNSRLIVTKGSVINFKGDCIVNAANERGLGGGFVDGAINHAGGPELKKARLALPVDKHGVRIPTGQARITIAGNLGSKWVAHAVGPRFSSAMDTDKQSHQLQSAYRNAIDLAVRKGATSIGFALLSAGVFKGPRSLGSVLKLGWDAVIQWCDDHAGTEKRIDAYFVAFKEDEKNELLLIAKAQKKITHENSLVASLGPVANKLRKAFEEKHYQDLHRKGVARSSSVSSKIAGNMRKLEYALLRDQLNSKYYSRPKRDDLISKGIIPRGTRSSIVEGARKALEYQMKIDQLNALFYARPQKDELVSRGIIPGGQRSSIVESKMKALEYQMKIDQLNAKIWSRPEKKDLVSRGIIPAGKRSSIVEGTMKELEYQMRIDQLNAMLYARPERDELVQRGIIPSGRRSSLVEGRRKSLGYKMRIDEMNNLFYSRAPREELIAKGILPNGNRSSIVEGARKELLYRMKIDQLNALTYNRPSMSELVARGILPSGSNRRSSIVESTKKALEYNMKVDRLNEMLYSRPKRETLVERGIIPYGEAYKPNVDQHQREILVGRAKQFHLINILFQKVTSMAQANKITNDQKGQLKDMIIDQNQIILSVAERFDMENDLNFFEGALIRLATSNI